MVFKAKHGAIFDSITFDGDYLETDDKKKISILNKYGVEVVKEVKYDNQKRAKRDTPNNRQHKRYAD